MENYSVLMTVYRKDNPDFVRASIDSMLCQTKRTDDFVLVCDGPLTKELDTLIDDYIIRYPDIFNVVHLKENVGLGAALKFGVTVCKNPIVARMDDDDIARKERCEVELGYLMEHPDVDLVGSNISEFEDDPNEPLRIKIMPMGHDAIMKFSKKRNPFNHSTVMFRKQSVIESGNYNEMRTNQDVDLWVRMINKGCKCDNIDQVLVDFRFDKNTLARRKEWNNAKLMIDVWKNFYKNEYCSYWDYLSVKWIQIAMYIMPSKLLNWVYNTLR